MSENWKKFMLESNRIEGEDRLNLNDEDAFDFAVQGIKTLPDIKHLHGILGRYLQKDWVGQWRKCNVRIGLSVPVKWQKVPHLMRDYMAYFPLYSSYQAHNDFEKIHPFRDLNGRVGRLIWLSKAVDEGYDYSIPFLQKYYYQTLALKGK